MAGSTSQSIGNGIVQSLDAQGQLVSYTVLGTSGAPLMIMEPTEYRIYSQLPPSWKEGFLTEPAWKLYLSSMMTRLWENEPAALEHMGYMFKEPGYWVEMGLGLALGASGSLLSRPAGSVLAQGGRNVVKGTATALQKFGGRSVDDLVAAATNPINKEGLTEAARALTKHASGQRTAGIFPKLSGGIEKQNSIAQGIVNYILKNPSSTYTDLSRGSLKAIVSDGRGLYFDSDGILSGLLDSKFKL